MFDSNNNNGGSPDDGLLFSAPLTTTLRPSVARGSAAPTFTRASTAYVKEGIDGQYRLALSGEARFQGARRVRNLIANPEAIDAWTLSNATVTTGVSDPAGGTSAFTVTATAGNGDAKRAVAVVSGNVSLPSVWLRRRTGTGTIVLYKGDDLTQVALTLTSSWQRFTSGVVTTVGNCFLELLIATSGDAVDAWHPQVEVVTGQANQNPSEYVSVGVLSAPYHGANVDGVKYFDTANGNTVASNVVTEATGAAISTSTLLGYWDEGARADVLGATAAIRRTMADAGWVNGGTMTVGSATGVDGVASAAASLTGGAVTATNTVLFTTSLTSAARTYGAWVRRKTGTGTIEMTDDGGTHWTTLTLTTTYQQFQMTRTQANPVVGFRITTLGDAIEVDFNTIEAATLANPTPIPVNVSKAADSLKYAVLGNFSNTTGTAYAEASSGMGAVASLRIIASADVANVSALNTGNGTYLGAFDGTTNMQFANWAVSSSVTKIASTWGGSASAGSVAGSAATAAAFDGSFGFTTSFNVGGQDANGNSLFGSVRNVRNYGRTRGDLAAMTA